MGKIFKKCIVFVVSILMVFSAVACDFMGLNNKTYSLNKTNIEYTIGTDFASVGLFLVNNNDSDDKIAVVKSMFSDPTIFNSECSNVETEVNYKNKTYAITVTVVKSSAEAQQVLREKLNAFVAKFTEAENVGNVKASYDVNLIAQFLNNQYQIDEHGVAFDTSIIPERFTEISDAIEKLVTDSLNEEFLEILNGETMLAKIDIDKILPLVEDAISAYKQVVLDAVSTNNHLVSNALTEYKEINNITKVDYTNSDVDFSGTPIYYGLSYTEEIPLSSAVAYHNYYAKCVDIVAEIENIVYGKNVAEALAVIKTKLAIVKAQAEILENNLINIDGIFGLNPYFWANQDSYGNVEYYFYGYEGMFTSVACESFIELIDYVMPFINGEFSTHTISDLLTDIVASYGAEVVFDCSNEEEMYVVDDAEILNDVDSYIDACLNLVVVFEDYIESKDIDKFLADLTDALTVIDGYSEEFVNNEIAIISNMPCVSLYNDRIFMGYSVFGPNNTKTMISLLDSIVALKGNYNELKDGLNDPIHACSNALKLLDFVNDYSFAQKQYSYDESIVESLELTYAYGKDEMTQNIVTEADKYYQGIIDIVVAIENFAAGSVDYVSTLNALKTTFGKIKQSSSKLVNWFVSYGFGFYRLDCQYSSLEYEGDDYYHPVRMNRDTGVFAPNNCDAFIELIDKLLEIDTNVGLDNTSRIASNFLTILEDFNTNTSTHLVLDEYYGDRYYEASLTDPQDIQQVKNYYNSIIDVVINIENLATGAPFAETLENITDNLTELSAAAAYIEENLISTGFGPFKLKSTVHSSEYIMIVGIEGAFNQTSLTVLIDILNNVIDAINADKFDETNHIFSTILDILKDYTSYSGHYTFEDTEDMGWYTELYNHMFEPITEEDTEIFNAINAYNEACLNILIAVEDIAIGATALETLTAIQSNIEIIDAQEVIFDNNYVEVGFYPFIYAYNAVGYEPKYEDGKGWTSLGLAERTGLFTHETNQAILDIIDDLLTQIDDGNDSWEGLCSYILSTYLIPAIEQQQVIDEIAMYFSLNASDISEFIDTYEAMTVSGEALLNFDIKNFAYDLVHLIFGKSTVFQSLMNQYVDMVAAIFENVLNSYPVMHYEGNTQLVTLLRNLISDFNNSLKSKDQPNGILDFVNELVFGGEESPLVNQIWSIVIRNLTIKELFSEDYRYFVVNSTCANNSDYYRQGELLILTDVTVGQDLSETNELVAFYNTERTEVVGIGTVVGKRLVNSQIAYRVMNMYGETSVPEYLIYGVLVGSTGIVVPNVTLNEVGEGLFKQLILDSIDFISDLDLIGSFDTYGFVCDMADILDEYLHTADEGVLPEDIIDYCKAFIKYQLGVISHKELTIQGKDLYSNLISLYVCTKISSYDSSEFVNLFEDVKQFVDGALTDYVNEEVDFIELASNLVNIVNTYGSNEVRAVVNTLTFLGLYVYENAYDANVDYNELFTNFQLPEFITDCDFNALIDKLTTADTYQNILSIGDITVQFVEEGGQIVKEILNCSIAVNFEFADKLVTLTSLIGTINLSLEVVY